MLNIFNIAMGFFCLFIASLADAKAVEHATKVWLNGRVNPEHIVRVFVYYIVSITPFLYSIRFFGYATVVTPSLQVLVWFLSTIVFIAILDKSIFNWGTANQTLALLISLALATLFYRLN
jgi:hypothetical protein